MRIHRSNGMQTLAARYFCGSKIIYLSNKSDRLLLGTRTLILLKKIAKKMFYSFGRLQLVQSR